MVGRVRLEGEPPYASTDDQSSLVAFCDSKAMSLRFALAAISRFRDLSEVPLSTAGKSKNLQDTKEYLNQGYLNRTFPGAKKRGEEGGGEEGRSGARMHRGLKGERGGRK